MKSEQVDSFKDSLTDKLLTKRRGIIKPHTRHQESFSSVGDATFSELVETFALRDARRVIYLADTLLTLTFSQEQPRGACMRHYVATYGLLRVNGVSHATTWVRRNLVCDEDRHVELLRDLLQSAHHSVQDLLALCKLTATAVVDPKRRHDAVNDEQGKAVFNHAASRLLQERDQTVDGEGATDKDVVEDALRVEVEPVRNGLDPLRSERVLGVDEENFTLSASLRSGHLSCDAESMTELGLACPELPKRLRY